MEGKEVKCPKCGAENPIYRKLSNTYICRSEICEHEFEFEPKEPLKPIIALSYFDRKYGPSLYYFYPKDILEKDQLIQIAKLMEYCYREFFIYKFNKINSMNYNFQIYSSWSRGGSEHLMVSIIFNSQTSPETEQMVLNICSEFSEKLKSNKEISTGLHINDLDKFDKKDKEDIIKNNSLFKLWIKELYLEILGDKSVINGKI